jgi:type II secretory pathway predicted ATPase ExeA
MPDEQPLYISNDKDLLDLALSIDPKVLSHFPLLEQPYRGGPDFRYLFTTDQVQEVLIQAVQLSVSRTAPFTLTGPYGTGKSTIITRTFSLLSSQKQYNVQLITLHKGVTRNWLIRKIAEAFGAKTARSYSQTLENVQAYLTTIDQTSQVPILIIDDGHFMDDACLSALYSLLNVEDNKFKLIQLIIAGQEPLLDNIARMGELESRMRSIEIAPMTPDELKKCFSSAGKLPVVKVKIFPLKTAIWTASTYSSGIPKGCLATPSRLETNFSNTWSAKTPEKPHRRMSKRLPSKR